MATRVLLVDDEKHFVDTLRERLEIRELKISCAYNGEEAVSWLKLHETDVVVLDVLMPGRDGIEILKEIKKAQPLVEVIMLTGNATVPMAIEGMKQGAFDFLLKPMDTEELTKKIRFARKRKAQQESRIRKAQIDKILEHRGW